MPISGKIILETPRLVLRRQVMEDLDDLWALYCDPDITRHIPDAAQDLPGSPAKNWNGTAMGTPTTHTWGCGRPSIKNRSLYRALRLAALDDRDQQEVEVAYTSPEPSGGRGWRPRRPALSSNTAFSSLKLQRLICLIDPENHASQWVAEKIGMSRERYMEGRNGDGIPFWIYSVKNKKKPAESE